MEVDELKFRSVFLMFSSGFVNLGKSKKQRKLWPIFLKKNLSVGKEKKKKFFFSTSLPHYF